VGARARKPVSLDLEQRGALRVLLLVLAAAAGGGHGVGELWLCCYDG
jgi:hypothetical protein